LKVLKLQGYILEKDKEKKSKLKEDKNVVLGGARSRSLPIDLPTLYLLSY